jgi:hypothetical protein
VFRVKDSREFSPRFCWSLEEPKSKVGRAVVPAKTPVIAAFLL